MTIKNKKMTSKMKKSKILSVLLLIAIVSSMGVVNNVNAVTGETVLPIPNIDSACTQKIVDEMHEKANDIDNVKAQSLASQNSEFILQIQGKNSTFNSVYNTWNIDVSNCSVTLKDVNAVYVLSDAQGYIKNLVVTLDPSLTRTLGVTEHVGAKYGFSTTSINWAGYELGGSAFTSSTNPTTPTYEGVTTFTVPSVSQPYTGACTTSLPCDVAIWTGLADLQAASNNHLAQAGVDRKIICNPTCTTSTYFWYEFLPALAFQCGGITINTEDSISVTVTNQAKTNPANNNKYNVSMQDLTSGQGCSLTGFVYNDMTSPKYGVFIDERASYPGTSGMATLAQFTSHSMSGNMYYGGSSKSIQTPYNNGWWREDVMINSGNTNIDPGVPSSGLFYQIYVTSTGT